MIGKRCALLIALAFGVAPAGAVAERSPVEIVAQDSSFDGLILISRGNARPRVASVGAAEPSRLVRDAYERKFDGAGSVRLETFDRRKRWRWASVTKQIVSVIAMQEVAAGRLDLDKPISAYLPGFTSRNAAQATVRQLLQHRAGLPNPDDTELDAKKVPAYYRAAGSRLRDPLTGYCAGPVRGAPGEQWSYNNCDFIVAGALLQQITRKSWPALVQERVSGPLGLKSVGTSRAGTPIQTAFDGQWPEPEYDVASFGASAALYGTIDDLWKFDRALMTGKLLPKALLDELWKGDPALGFMALGRWVFSAPVKGCAEPMRIVERRGQIGGSQVRNFILPDLDAVVIAFGNRGEFEFGEVWQGKGFSHDLLSVALCKARK